MTVLRNKGFFSKKYIAEENGTVIAELNRDMWHQRAEMKCLGRTLKLTCLNLVKSTYALCDGDTKIAEIKMSNIMGTKLSFQYLDNDFELVKKAWYSEILLLKSNDSVVGSIRPKDWFSCDAVIDLPNYLPLSLRIFIAWVGVIRWEDSATFGATSSGG